MKKILVFVLLHALPIICFAANKEIITICELQKSVYVFMEPFNSTWKDIEKSNHPSAWQLNDKPNGDSYILFLEEKKGKNIINVEYKSKKLPIANWNLLEEAKNYNGTVKFLTTNPYNIVIHTSNKGNNPREQIYYFNLDDKANGVMTMVNTKYKSMIDTVNNQAFHFCTCKSPINK